jgi:hypothetical protein
MVVVILVLVVVFALVLYMDLIHLSDYAGSGLSLWHWIWFPYGFSNEDVHMGPRWNTSPDAVVLLVHGLYSGPARLTSLVHHLSCALFNSHVLSIAYNPVLSRHHATPIKEQEEHLVEAIVRLQKQRMKNAKIILGGVELGGVLVRRVAHRIPNLVGWFSMGAPHRGGMCKPSSFNRVFAGPTRMDKSIRALCDGEDPHAIDVEVTHDVKQLKDKPVLLMGADKDRVPMWSALMVNDTHHLAHCFTVPVTNPTDQPAGEWFNQPNVAVFVANWIRRLRWKADDDNPGN